MSELASPDTGGDLVQLFDLDAITGLTEMDAMGIKSVLEASGITVVLSGSPMLPNLPFELLVPAESRELALSILKEAQAAGPDAADAAEREGEAQGDHAPPE